IAHERLAIFASTDPLTGVLNRAAFMTLVKARLSARQSEGRPGGALMILDADDFKAINDTYGHDQGDEALRLLTAAVRGALRDSDLLGRIGGEEFAVLLPDT